MALQQHILEDVLPNRHDKLVSSIVHGPSYPPLVSLTLGGLLDLQCRRYGSNDCVVIPWTGARWTYDQLRDQSINLAKQLLHAGIRPGDTIGVMAGNCEQYAAIIFAAARVGAILAVLHNTYTSAEALRALGHTGCKILFTTFQLGSLDNSVLISNIKKNPQAVPKLQEVVILYGDSHGHQTYRDLVDSGSIMPDNVLDKFTPHLNSNDICMLLFTSGSTGAPKAASLTHHNVVNNSRFVGDRMDFTHEDRLCCPPPLFHCFGLVLGLLACITHGASVIFPAELFDAPATLRAIAAERATALHGVPAMFDSLFSIPRSGLDLSSLRTGIIAGSPVPRHLMELMSNEFGMTQWTSSYGLTEASPTCFNATTGDSMHRKLTTVGRIMPHAQAKIVDHQGNIVPVGTRGELCIAGYQLQAGYWLNPAETAKAMVQDEDGVVWLRTGDEAVFDEDGYCSITGRFKDLIIRGGENIYPLEIEDRLVAHPCVERAIVVGINHPRLGEVVGAILQRKPGCERPTDAQIKRWTGETLGRHKCPERIFWLGEDGFTGHIPLTGSGKIQKFALRAVAEQWLLAGVKTAKL